MRDKRDNKPSRRGQSSEGRSFEKKTGDNRSGLRKNNSGSEKSSYFDRKEEKRSSGFSTNRRSESSDERKPRFRDNNNEDRKPRFSNNNGEDRKPRFRDNNSEEGKSRFRDNNFDRKRDDRKDDRRFDKRTFSRNQNSDDRVSGRQAEISKYMEDFESQNTAPRKPRRESFKDLGYEEKSSRLIDRNSVEDETRNTYIYGRHPVIEALKGETPVNKVWIAEGTRDTNQIIEHVIEKNIPYKIVTKTKLSYLVGESTNHQGVVAEVAGKEYTEFSDLIDLTKQKEVFFIVLDKVEDPHNLGAIIRTADAAGVDAIIVPKHRAVGLTGIVTKSSAGAIDRMKICRVTNLVQAIEELKQNNVWIVGVDMEGSEVYSKANLKGPIALTVGGEGEGLTRLVKEHCDFVVNIPMSSASNSLNVSVATAIVTFEIYKQKDFK